MAIVQLSGNESVSNFDYRYPLEDIAFVSPSFQWVFPIRLVYRHAVSLRAPIQNRDVMLLAPARYLFWIKKAGLLNGTFYLLKFVYC